MTDRREGRTPLDAPCCWTIRDRAPPLTHVVGFGFLAPSKDCWLPRGHREVPILRNRINTSAKYHAHRRRSVSCFTHGKKKIYLFFTWKPPRAASLTLVRRGPANLDRPRGCQ